MGRLRAVQFVEGRVLELKPAALAADTLFFVLPLNSDGPVVHKYMKF